MTAPAAGATVGGAGVSLGTSPADGGSGVATVEFRLDGASIGTVTSAPWQLAWDASTTPSGAHTIDAVVTDAAGNSTTTAGVPITVDSTPPTVTLADPGALLSGNVTLIGDIARSGHRQGRLPGQPGRVGRLDGSGERRDAAVLGRLRHDDRPDGQFDFRAIAHDSSRQRLDAERRRLATHRQHRARRSSLRRPQTDRRWARRSSISVTASEPLASVTGATLDGGRHRRTDHRRRNRHVATGPLADGPHTLAGTFVDAAGKIGALHDPLHDRQRPAASELALRRDECVPGPDDDAHVERRRRHGHDDRR